MLLPQSFTSNGKSFDIWDWWQLHHLNSPLITSPCALFGIGVNFNIKDAQCCVVCCGWCSLHWIWTPANTDLIWLTFFRHVIATTNKDDCFSALLSLVRVVGALIRLTMPTNLYSLYPSHYKHHFYPSHQNRQLHESGSSCSVRHHGSVLVPGPSLPSSCGVLPAATVLWSTGAVCAG